MINQILVLSLYKTLQIMLLLFQLETLATLKGPITNEKPEHYQVHDINFSVHNVEHTYRPELTEPIVPTN